MAPAQGTTDEGRTTDRRRRGVWSALTASPGTVRGVVALLVLLAIYLVGALSHLHVLGL